MWQGFKIPLCTHCEIRKDFQKCGSVLAKIVKSLVFVKLNLPCRFNNEETCFISFKDLPCTLRSKHIFRQYIIFHAFSILATQLAR